jgi:hypothetical protein
MSDALRFGEKPLRQTVAAAAELRRLTGLLVTLEHAHPTVDAMLAQVSDWCSELAAVVPPDGEPRIGEDPDGIRRLYLDHAFDIGAYNPCFPEYRLEPIDADRPHVATGTVTFPLVYEGPPGMVHGGFLGVFFDCVTQQHNCATSLSGKTRSLTVKYRRPTPLLTELRFDVERVEGEYRSRPGSDIQRGLVSTARLLFDDEVLCIGVVETVALPPERLTGAGFGARRPESG